MTTTLEAPHQSPVNAEHFYGWIRSLGDINNDIADTTGLTTKNEVDPRDEMPDPYDQAELGSCTANASAGAIEYNEILNGTHYGTPSRLFIYYGERVIEKTVSYDSGAYGHDAFKVASHQGTPPETLWSYDDYQTKFKLMPDAAAYKAALEHKIGKYTHPALNQKNSDAERWNTLQQILSNNQTVIFGFTVYESFESLDTEKTGIVKIPKKGEKVLGGHEVLLIGYIVYKGTLYALVRNSWGKEWGLKGYCLFPLEYLMNLELCNDFRTLWRPAGS